MNDEWMNKIHENKKEQKLHREKNVSNQWNWEFNPNNSIYRNIILNIFIQITCKRSIHIYCITVHQIQIIDRYIVGSRGASQLGGSLLGIPLG